LEELEEIQPFLEKLMNMLEMQFGQNCEILLHDYSKGYEQSIVDIRNGHITGRKVGNCGNNLGLEVLKGTTVDGDRYNYITHTKDGKVLRSSSMYFYEGKKVIGSLCINTDITDELRYENYLHAKNNYSFNENEKEEVFATDVNHLLDYFIEEGQRIIGKPAVFMEKKDKLEFLKYLDNVGAFLISKSSVRIGKLLGISKGTLYSYLEIIHVENEDKEGEVNEKSECK
jgi:predicted transcriptional regulator YheO